MNITIDGQVCQAEAGEYILAIATRNNINIPTLCHNDALAGLASCRLCIVEVVENGWTKIVTSCVYPVTKEIEVITASPKIIAMRRTLIKLLAARVPNNPYVNKLREEYEVLPTARFAGDAAEHCILCGLCVKACEKIGAAAIATVNRGITKKVSTPFDEPAESCIGCNACAQVCPTGAIITTDEGQENRLRTIWRKQFQLLQCQSCGQHFTTKEQVDYINKQLANVPAAGEELLCEKCRRIAVTGKFKELAAYSWAK